jgi:pyruvate kinase
MQFPKNENNEFELSTALSRLYTSMKKGEREYSFLLEKLHPSQRASAANLLHYLFLRNHDLEPLQRVLHLNGFSTLNNSEGYVQSQLLSILQHFGFNNGHVPCDYSTAQKILKERVTRLFGETKEDNIPSIMVTFKTSFARDYLAVKKLLKAGMNIARINCAHDDEATWLEMIKVVRDASEFSGIPCKIYMDLAGPKMRTRIKEKKNRIEVEEEDIILLTDRDGVKSKLPVVGCSLPNVVAQLKVDERIIFDDGLIETKVVGFKKGGAELEVTRVSSKKPFLKSEKGINFPDSDLHISALSDFDRECIPFIIQHADMIGYSFVRSTADLGELQNLLRDIELPIVLKIEKPEAMINLPSLLFAAMSQQFYGVMIARGDLAVELGFENISEAQDEIIGLCRAAHAPVIYATQVLETMNKKGLPTRAEVTDAAYGIWSDCVMLNKGMHTVKAVNALKQILLEKASQVSGHHAVLKPLNISKAFFEKYRMKENHPVES